MGAEPGTMDAGLEGLGGQAEVSESIRIRLRAAGDGDGVREVHGYLLDDFRWELLKCGQDIALLLGSR